jgi:hypothetical protein
MLLATVLIMNSVTYRKLLALPLVPVGASMSKAASRVTNKTFYLLGASVEMGRKLLLTVLHGSNIAPIRTPCIVMSLCTYASKFRMITAGARTHRSLLPCCLVLGFRWLARCLRRGLLRLPVRRLPSPDQIAQMLGIRRSVMRLMLIFVFVLRFLLMLVMMVDIMIVIFRLVIIRDMVRPCFSMSRRLAVSLWDNTLRATWALISLRIGSCMMFGAIFMMMSPMPRRR